MFFLSRFEIQATSSDITRRVETGLLSGAQAWLGQLSQLPSCEEETVGKKERQKERQLTPDMPWDTGSFGEGPDRPV